MAKAIPSVFYFTDHILIAYTATQQQIIEVCRFQLNTEGRNEFENWLPNSGIKPIYHPVYLVVDSRLEEYQIDTVPHVRGRNSKELLNHRLRRLYTNTTYTHASILGRAKSKSPNSKRQDDQALFMALNNAENIQPWVRLLLAQRISIHGIYSLPLLTQHLVAQLDLPDNILLVTHTEQVAANNPQGLRQSFFHKRRLEASRLIPLPIFSQTTDNQLANKTNYPTYVNNEIRKTLQYLIGHALISADEILTVLMFGDPQLLLEIKQTTEQYTATGLEFRFYPTLDFLAQNGLHQYPQPAYFHFLALQQVAEGKIPNHYAQIGEIFYDTHLKLRQKIHSSTNILLFVGLLMSGFIAYQGWQSQQAHAKLQAQIDNLQLEEKKAKEQVGTDIAPRHMRNAVEVAKKLRNNRFKPHQALAKLGQELKKFPELKLRRIKWEVLEIENEQEKKLAQGNSEFNALFLEKQRKEGKLDTRFQQVLEVEGQVWPLRDNLQAQRAFNSFAKRLKQEPELDVTILEQPINKLDDAFQENLAQDENLKTSQATKSTTVAGFKLKLTFGAAKPATADK